MSDAFPELSSISSGLHELTHRIASLAEQLLAAGQQADAHELFEVERSLITGQRRLAKIVDR